MRITSHVKRKRILLFVIIILIILSVVSYFGYQIFTTNRITKFDISTENLSCTTTPEIASYLQSLKLNYFYYQSDGVNRALQKKFFCIGKIEQTISYPDKLAIKLTGRTGKFIVKTIDTTLQTNPQIVLSLEQMNATQSTSEAMPPKVLSGILNTYKEASSSSVFLVDGEGVVFQEGNSDFDLPQISMFARDFKIGQTIPDNLIPKVADVLTRLIALNTPVDNLIVVGDRLIIDSKPRIMFSLSRPIDRQSASLQLILRQAKMNLDPDKSDTRSIESIDLRFDRPVVVYSR